jgi:N,N-dimethylformamidase beta subunit-like protein
MFDSNGYGIDGYATACSVLPGSSIGFKVKSVLQPPGTPNVFDLKVYRAGSSGFHDQLMLHVASINAPSQTDGANPSVNGYGWVTAYTLSVPGTWPSGAYTAYVTNADTASADILFVVLSSNPGLNQILIELPVNTDQAYNETGGLSLYTIVNNHFATPIVSFDRPTPVDTFTSVVLPFIRWLVYRGINVDYCTSVDLHSNARILDPYQVLVSVGHDEYWSKEMRDSVEAFIANGGNVAFFSGNTCWWQVRYGTGNRTLLCYRPPDPPGYDDPIAGSDPSRVTTNWYLAPVSRPEDSMWGVDSQWNRGAGWWGCDGCITPPSNPGYSVAYPTHWVYGGTGLVAGNQFGGNASPAVAALGYEASGAPFTADPTTGAPILNLSTTPSPGDTTPVSFIPLATADLSNWGSCTCTGTSSRDGQPGHPTLGLYHANGTVFTASTVGWAKGLTMSAGGTAPIDIITLNVLQRLLTSHPSSPQLVNRGFETWVGSVPQGWTLEGTGAAIKNSAPFSGQFCLQLDGTNGQTWISQNFVADGACYYRLACWMKTSQAGASIAFQSTDTWAVFALASHSGSGQWEYVQAVGLAPSRHMSNGQLVGTEAPLLNARVRFLVAAGVVAYVDNVVVETL